MWHVSKSYFKSSIDVNYKGALLINLIKVWQKETFRSKSCFEINNFEFYHFWHEKFKHSRLLTSKIPKFWLHILKRKLWRFANHDFSKFWTTSRKLRFRLTPRDKTRNSLLNYVWSAFESRLNHVWITFESRLSHVWITFESRLNHVWIKFE